VSFDNRHPADQPRAVPMLPRVWTCVLVGVDGIETWICETEDLAYRELAHACRRFWADALDFGRRFDRGEGQTPLPAKPPGDDRSAVEAYFATMRRALPAEYFVIVPRQVIGGTQTGCVR
jgi:hypothetical protein